MLREISADEIRQFRTVHNLSQLDLARRVGVSPSTVSNWEAGRALSRDQAERLKQAMETARAAPIQQESSAAGGLIIGIAVASAAVVGYGLYQLFRAITEPEAHGGNVVPTLPKQIEQQPIDSFGETELSAFLIDGYRSRAPDVLRGPVTADLIGVIKLDGGFEATYRIEGPDIGALYEKNAYVFSEFLNLILQDTFGSNYSTAMVNIAHGSLTVTGTIKWLKRNLPAADALVRLIEVGIRIIKWLIEVFDSEYLPVPRWG